MTGRGGGAAAGLAPRVVTPIVALDVGSLAEAVALTEVLGPAASYYKIGGELFTAAGPAAVEAVLAGGRDVFLDLKFHDIPNTVRGSARSAARLGARLLTVHASGGRAMLQAAVDGAGEGCGVLAVTVLTSMDPAALGDAWGRSVARMEDEVLRLAELAVGAGAHGIVCSGAEAAMVRLAFGDRLRVLVPGVRPAGSGRDDQARAVTPEEAREAGADYVVLGRAVTRAPSPREALSAIAEALQGRPR